MATTMTTAMKNKPDRVMMRPDCVIARSEFRAKCVIYIGTDRQTDRMLGFLYNSQKSLLKMSSNQVIRCHILPKPKYAQKCVYQTGVIDAQTNGPTDRQTHPLKRSKDISKILSRK